MRVAPGVELWDESQGLFGELIPPAVVWQGLSRCDNVGHLDHPMEAQATQAIHSFTASSQEEVCIEFENATALPITVRWLDECGRSFDHFNFPLDAFSSAVRYTRLGHLFLVSVAAASSSGAGGSGEGGHSWQDEELLGAYRIRMPLPSKSPHYLRLEQTGTYDNTTNNSTTTNNNRSTATFVLESILADPTGEDELIVTAAALDTVGAGPQGARLAKTIHILHTILHNLRQHPTDAKFHTLRLSNPTIHKHIGSHGAALRLLELLGFVRATTTSTAPDTSTTTTIEGKDDDINAGEPCLTWTAATHDWESQQQKLDRACRLLDQLRLRSQPGFVAELAETPPWQGPLLTSNIHAAHRAAFGAGGTTHFLSDDEKWQRAERNRNRRGRSGRRPEPGHAPSSNGAWGR